MMDRGHELESEAVAFAEFHLGLDSEPVGFMTNDERTIGASPDRLIGDHALLEIKCPGSVAIHMGHLVDGTVLKAHRVQAQGQLWIAEREKAYVVSYYPGLPNAIGETDRDEAFIALLKEAVEEFVTEMEKIKSNLAERGIIPAVAVAAVEDEEMDFPWLKESK